MIRRVFIIAFAISSSAYITGCAEFNIFEAPAEVIRHPLGTDPIRIGMEKDEVIAKWGRPDQINSLAPSDEWKMAREEWVYIGRYSKIPLDRSYLFKTKYLIFDGDNLVSIGEESRQRPVKREGVESTKD